MLGCQFSSNERPLAGGFLAKRLFLGDGFCGAEVEEAVEPGCEEKAMAKVQVRCQTPPEQGEFVTETERFSSRAMPDCGFNVFARCKTCFRCLTFYA